MMCEPISPLARLRAGTRDAHARIEAVPALARLLADDLTRDEYVSVLQHMHAFHAHIEPVVGAALAMWPEAAAMLDGARPRALSEDLAWFGADAILPPVLGALDSPAAALGALYVIEGSGLGARVIARHLMASLGVFPGAGGSFYCRQDAETARQQWRRLIALLEASSFDEGAAGTDLVPDQAMVEGARLTFHYLEQWLRTIEIVPEHVHALVMAEAVTP